MQTVPSIHNVLFRKFRIPQNSLALENSVSSPFICFGHFAHLSSAQMQGARRLKGQCHEMDIFLKI
jgi:hypothetical protein